MKNGTQRQQMEQRIQDLVDGKAKPRDDKAAYVVSKIQKLMERAAEGQRQLDFARQQVRTMEQALTKTRGALEQYTADLAELDQKARETAEKAVPSPAGAPQNGVHEEVHP